MENVFIPDKNGKVLKVGDEVNVPEPNGNDIHNHEFVGTIDSITQSGFVNVIDGDNNMFCFHPNRLELYDENDNQLSPDEIEKLKQLVPSTN